VADARAGLVQDIAKREIDGLAGGEQAGAIRARQRSDQLICGRFIGEGTLGGPRG
jgi:hypothetical protein